MGAVTDPKKKYTQEEYLDLERKAEIKSEYFKGEIFAMSGASLVHNRITMNFLGILSTKLKGGPRQYYGSDLRVHVPANTLYTYPDITVVCGKEQMLDQDFDTLLNPIFIAEVLSPSTADYDTGRKFGLYCSIETLKEYWTISAYECRVQKFVKNESNNTWVFSEATSLNESITVESLNIVVPMMEPYDGVTF